MIDFKADQELILLDFPQRYVPMMPSGIGYVHELLKTSNLQFQTVDLNIILYHQYHDGKLPKLMDGDPWDTTSMMCWSDDDFLDKLQPTIDSISISLIKARPKIIGVSASGTNRKFALRVLSQIRERCPEIIILVGGYDCAYHYVAPRIFPIYDYMVIREAEITLLPLLHSIMKGESPHNLPGIISRNDTLPFQQAEPIFYLDDVPFPTYDWTDPLIYRTKNGIYKVPLSGSRGCSWARCTFCSEAWKWRRRSPRKIVDEMEYWRSNYGVYSFSFNESDMAGDLVHLMAICDQIIARDLKLIFSGLLHIRKGMDRDFFRKLYQAGCRQVACGVDAWCNHTARLQNKGYDMEIIESVLKACRQSGIVVETNIVIGVPGETEQDIEESIRNIIRMKPYITSMQNLNMLILGAGSQFYDNPERYGIIFRGEKAKIYHEHPYIIPAALWYSDDPFIDLGIRLNRRNTIYKRLREADVPLTTYVDFQAAGGRD